jgi:hypothetical protein
MALRPFQFTIRQLTTFAINSAILVWMTQPTGFVFPCAFIYVAVFVTLRADWRAGILGRMLAACTLFAGYLIGWYVQFYYLYVPADPVVAWLIQCSLGAVWGIVVGTAVYIMLKLMKQYIDGMPLRDDSCGPIGWHLFDDKGYAASNLE